MSDPVLAVHGNRPVFMAWQAEGPDWRYCWWDQGDSYITGEPPTRSKTFRALGGVLAAVLADAARCHAVHAEVGLSMLAQDFEARHEVASEEDPEAPPV